MHKNLIKWLSEVLKKKKEKGVPHMNIYLGGSLEYSKVYNDVTERCLLGWNQNKHITYYAFHIVIRKSVLIFLTIAQIRYQHISIIRCS